MCIDDFLEMQIPCVSLVGFRPMSNELSSHLVELLFGNQRSVGREEIMVGLELLRREIGTGWWRGLRFAAATSFARGGSLYAEFNCSDR
jgi:hypothetical protein